MRAILRAPVLVAVLSLSAGAQGIGVGVGTLVPQGDLADGAETGFAAIASLEMGTKLALRIEALWANSDLKGRIITDGSGVPLPSNADVSGDVKYIGGLASVVMHFGTGALRPYVLGGAGYYNRSGSQRVSEAAGEFDELSLKDSDFGLHFGAGVKLGVSGFSLFGEARYHRVESDDVNTNFVPILVGVRIGG